MDSEKIQEELIKTIRKYKGRINTDTDVDEYLKDCMPYATELDERGELRGESPRVFYN